MARLERRREKQKYEKIRKRHESTYRRRRTKNVCGKVPSCAVDYKVTEEELKAIV